MSAALRPPPLPPHRLTIPEFLEWADAPGNADHWQLRDGEPELMAPPSTTHAAILAELGRLLGNHLLTHRGGACRVYGAPGVVPRGRADHNMLVPDLAVACGPPTDDRALRDPLVLIEIMSPSNEAQTRANLWTFLSIPSVAEIVVVGSVAIAAEVFRRQPDGSWPERPDSIGSDAHLAFASLDFALPLRDLYRTTTLA